MHRITGIIVCLALLSSFATAQTPAYPKGYFRWPLDLKPEIVANLGELRSNHWHMGLDIRTAQKVNQRVYAAAEGYVARIGVRPLSFGRFIVIHHPNGLSTLYAHLNEFAPDIEAYVTQEQYRQESWAVELEVPKGRLPVKKGTFISYSGTTGGSQGPHVHFEIRDTRTDKCLNPMMFGFPLPDAVKPSIVKLAMYDRTQSSYNGSPQFFPLKLNPEGYVLPKNPIVRTGSSKVSFAIQAYDRISGSNNQDGIYSASVSVDGVQQVKFIIDSVGYDYTKFMNAHIDYHFKYNGGAYLQHISRLPGDRGTVYHPADADGVIRLYDTLAHDVLIEVEDGNKNKSVVRFKLQYVPSLSRTSQVFSGMQFIPNYVSVLEKDDFECYLPEGAIYDTINSVYSRSEVNASNLVTALHQVNDPSYPVHDNLRIRIKANRPIPDHLSDRVLMTRSYRSTRQVKKASLKDGWLSADFGDFGTYAAYIDNTAPSINWIGAGDTVNLSSANRISFTPTDDFGIKSFRAELNGKWLRFTNDKARTWIYTFDERCPYGVHELRVVVEDLAGNITERRGWFKRYPYTPPPKKAVKKKSGKTSAKKTVTKKKRK